jgi:hypothetical protein
VTDDPLAGMLDACGCCEMGLEEPTVSNRPGLTAVAYRIGTHPDFLRRMLAALPAAPYPHDPSDPNRPRPLESLTTRSPDDPSIALLDAWATVADVLAFYQERIACEGYLRTVTERRSVLELARSIGYELRPGVAAGTYLAFTVETATGAPESAVVSEGTKVRSIPGQGQVPQTFETVAEIEARAEWNAMRPRRTQPQQIVRGQTSVLLTGVSTGLQRGDGILVVGDERASLPGSERWDFRIVRDVIAVPSADPAEPGHTRVSWDLGLGEDKEPGVLPAQDHPKVYALRRRASLFGYNAPDWRTMPSDVQEDFAPADYTGDEWPGFELPSSGDPVVQLDAYYPRVLPQGWLVFAGPNYTELYRAENVEPSARADFGIASKTTRILFDAGEHLSWFAVRSTVVHAESEELQMADEPIAVGVSGREVTIRPAVTPPVPGQYLVFTGRPSGTGPDADRVRETAVVDLVIHRTDETTIRLAADLQIKFDPQDLRVCANVAPATHGEAVEGEVLGGGDAAAAFQRFALKKSPLTFVSGPTPSGVASTLNLRVNGVAWDEAASLDGAGPRDQRYVVRVDDEQRTALVFGDGRSGSRLPTGQENVTATYRSGLGPDGNLDADTLTLLQTRPLGIRGVTNPVPSDGGAAPERLDDAKANAPLTVLTLDRIVTLRDFEDFARAFAGIAKAQATALWSGERFTAHVTIAGADGAEVSGDSLLFANLLDAIESIRDPSVRFQIASYRAKSFLVAARVLADERLEQASVFERVAAVLRAEFSFDRRSFAQPVTSAEMITAIQGVEGVVASNLAALYAFDPASPPPAEFEPPPPEEVLPAERGALAGNLGAELLLVDPARISVEPMSP